MSFDFLGKIRSLEQFEEFEEFVTIEITRVDARISHIQREKTRFHEILDKFKVADLKLRADYSKTDQPDADWIINPRPITNQENKIVWDSINAKDMSSLKKTFIDPIKYRRERNEFKIKRIRDLLEQFSNEVNYLTKLKEDYLNILNKIKNRFDLKDFKEMQITAPSDPADVTKGIRAIDKNAGRDVSNKGIVSYYILSISNNRIIFENVLPPLVAGSKLVLSGGKNDGIKTVTNIINSRTVEVFEDLITECPSTTKVQKG